PYVVVAHDPRDLLQAGRRLHGDDPPRHYILHGDKSTCPGVAQVEEHLSGAENADELPFTSEYGDMPHMFCLGGNFGEVKILSLRYPENVGAHDITCLLHLAPSGRHPLPLR